MKPSTTVKLTKFSGRRAGLVRLIRSATSHQAIDDLRGGEIPRGVPVGGQFDHIEAHAFPALQRMLLTS